MHASTVIPQNSWQAQNKTMFSWRFIFQALYKQQKLNQNKVKKIPHFIFQALNKQQKLNQNKFKKNSVIFHF